jgi:hypothetical protein
MEKENIMNEDDLSKYSEEEKEKIIEYLKTLTDIEIKALKIAKTMLMTSFNIVRSNGYNAWLKNNSL